MNDKEREELAATLMHMKNAIVSLYEHLAPDFTTRDFAILKYGLTSEESGKLEKYLIDHHIQNKAPTKEEVRSKLAEIEISQRIAFQWVKWKISSKVIYQIT
ncbi:hypothetical protein ACO1D0_24325 [Bacillus licheniformis]|uniref:hypothetical protein n=1 Tax=Bacillus licheniformis TaxID=1402 RepID=UPI003BF626D5